MRFVRFLSILACLIGFGAAGAQALEISEETNGNFQEYLKTIGSTKKGAFAISPDGYYSYYIYCTETNCIADGIGRDALKKCASLSGQECSLMAFGRDVRIPFTVFAMSVEISPDDEIMKNILDAEQLKAIAVGNTMQGEYTNAIKWVEFYDPNGEIRGKDDKQGPYKASYTLRGDQMCFDFPGTYDDWCAQISMRGNRVDFINKGKLVTFLRNTTFVDGNPNGL